ncbi:MAG: PAS domain S-box protein [Magnetococcales bacterium]|nr:PAS domain S-box protein [Magnetococcales bacterium]
MPAPSSSSITTRFIITFSLLFIAIFSIAIWIFLHGFPGSTFLGWFGDERNQAIRTINILADMQKDRVLQTFKELRSDAGFLAQDRFLKEQLKTILSLPRPESAPTEETTRQFSSAFLEPFLQELQSHAPYYRDIHILNIEGGSPILSTHPEMDNRDLVKQQFIDRIRTTRQDYIGEFLPPEKPESFLVGSPIFLNSEDPSALVILEISLAPFLQPIVAIAMDPWSTAVEVIVVNEQGIDLVHPGPPLFKKEADEENIVLLPTKIASSGQEGFIETQDRNNVMVLAAYRHIRLFSEWSWGLVVQMDQEDLMQPMTTAVGFALFIGFMATGAFILVAFLLTRRLTRPLRRLTEAAHQLSAGHRYVRSQHSGKDEVGVLAKAFDTMADEVARTLDNLERTVAQRTIALALELDNRKRQQREQQIIEASLKESEHRYRSLVDTMTAGVAVYEACDNGADFIIRDINRMGTLLTRTRKEEILGKRVTEVFPGIHAFGLFDVFQRVYRTALPANHPVALYSDQRLKLWFENRVYKLPSGEIVAIFDDISERKLAEDALNLVQFSVDNTRDAMLWFSPRGHVVRCNQAASIMLGYSREELLSLSAVDIIEGMTMERWGVAWKRITHSEPQIDIAHLRRRDRSHFPVEISASHLQGDDLKPDHLFMSARDISERLRAEREKQTLEQMAFHRERLATIGTLAAGVAHEINNPNNAIQFNAVMLLEIWPDLQVLLAHSLEEHQESLLAGLPASESLDTIPRLLEGIRKGSERIQGIIGNLKHLSRQDQAPVRKPFDLREVLYEAIGILRGQISRHTDHFHTRILEEPVHVLGNSRQLEQVFINLLLNALQALSQRTCAVEISMTHEAVSKEVQVIISDEGIGIPEENMAKLTHPFFTTKGERDGTGLGLSIANSIIVNHGGRMSFASKEHEGTRVTVTLPVMTTEKRGDHP